MGEGSGHGSGRVRLFVGNVGLGRVNVSPGRVGPKKSDPWTTLVIDIKCIKKFLLELKMHHYRWRVVVVVEFTLAT